MRCIKGNYTHTNGWQAHAGDRVPLDMARRRLARWALREVADSACGVGAAGPWVVDCDSVMGRSPEAGLWRGVLREGSKLGGGSGTGKQASREGAVFMVRSGQLGLPADYERSGAEGCSACMAPAGGDGR